MNPSKYIGGSGYRSPLLSYPVVYILCLLEVVLYSLTHYDHFFTNSDSFQYIRAGELLFQGQLDIFRTPTYPLIIGVLRLIFGEAAWNWALYAIQFITLIVSAYFMRRIAGKLFDSPKVTFWLIAVFLLWPGYSKYSVMILTEIFGVAATVFLTWFLVKNVWAPKLWDVVRAMFWLLFLVFERPIFIYLIPIVLLWYAVVAFRARRNRCLPSIAVAAAGLMIICVSLFAYRKAIQRDYGIKSVSAISTVNNYCLIREAGIPLAVIDSDSPALMAAVAANGPGETGFSDTHFQEIDSILYTGEVTQAEFETVVNRTISQNHGPVIRHLANRIFEITPSEYFFHQSSLPLNIITPDFRLYWITMIIFAVCLIIAWRRSRRIPMVALLLYAISLGIVAASIIGAMSVWDRLTYPGLPAYLLLAGQFISSLTLNIKAFAPTDARY